MRGQHALTGNLAAGGGSLRRSPADCPPCSFFRVVVLKGVLPRGIAENYYCFRFTLSGLEAPSAGFREHRGGRRCR